MPGLGSQQHGLAVIWGASNMAWLWLANYIKY